ncbi:MAG: hypothetical protein AAF125_17430 [Chloroflexota bacterium]
MDANIYLGQARAEDLRREAKAERIAREAIRTNRKGQQNWLRRLTGFDIHRVSRIETD